MTQSERMDYTDMNDNGILDLDFYFDFLCPFTYQASRWIRQVSELMGPEVIAVRWRFFSLEQNNLSKQQPGWNIWDQQPGGELRGLLAFAAGGAASNLGGDEALNKFYKALGKLFHEDGLPLWEKETIQKAWTEAGLDNAALAKVLDGSDRSGLEKLKKDHTEAVERYNAFGSPTLVFEEHRSFYLKIMPAPADVSDALELFQHLQRLAMGVAGGIMEFKRTMTETQEKEHYAHEEQWFKGSKLLWK